MVRAWVDNHRCDSAIADVYVAALELRCNDRISRPHESDLDVDLEAIQTLIKEETLIDRSRRARWIVFKKSTSKLFPLAICLLTPPHVWRVTCLVATFGFPLESAFGDITLHAGEDIQAAINNNPGGTTFIFTPGVYRLTQGLVPKSKDRFIGRPPRAAILNGSRQVTTWTQAGNRWYANVPTQHTPWEGEVCNPKTYTGCRYSDAVFYDDQTLWRVMSLAELTPSKVYIDTTLNRVYIANSPNGHKVEQAIAPRAFRSWQLGQIDNVTLQGLVIEKFANEANSGALEAMENWVIENNEVRLNHGIGIIDGGVVRGNYVHHNGQSGMGSEQRLVENNEIAFNNTAGFDWEGWDGGGTKWVKTRNLIVRGNYVHDNYGMGLWTDSDNIGTVYENNRVENNKGAGIFHEASYDAVIRNNIIRGNGFGAAQWWFDGAGLLLNSSQNVEITSNVVENNYNGILFIAADRGSGAYGRYDLKNVYVHDNKITMSRGYTGLILELSDTCYYTSKNNRFVQNTYCLADVNGKFYQWMNDSRTKGEWQAFGEDVNAQWFPISACPSRPPQVPRLQRNP